MKQQAYEINKDKIRTDKINQVMDVWNEEVENLERIKEAMLKKVAL